MKKILRNVLEGNVEEKLLAFILLTLGQFILIHSLCEYGCSLQTLPLVTTGVVCAYFAYYILATISEINNKPKNNIEKSTKHE